MAVNEADFGKVPNRLARKDDVYSAKPKKPKDPAFLQRKQ